MNRIRILIVICFALILSSCGSKTQPASSEEWTQLTSMPTPRSEMPASAIDTIIYVPGGFGGENTFEAYDTTTNT